jgi:hypothetical protein
MALCCMQILGWVCASNGDESVRFACSHALAALAADPGPAGLAIARAWFGELLVHLTLNVKTHASIRQVRLLTHAATWQKPLASVRLKMRLQSPWASSAAPDAA